jgi:hypothetical protein
VVIFDFLKSEIIKLGKKLFASQQGREKGKSYSISALEKGEKSPL